MFERKDSANTFFKPDIKPRNSSLFTVYNDGIGFSGYSVRLSNFSFNNIPRNLALLTTFSLSIGASLAEKVAFTTVNILNGNDHFYHYRVATSPVYLGEKTYADGLRHMHISLNSFIQAISKGTCNVIYKPDRQDEYLNLKFQAIYKLPKQLYSFSSGDIELQRDSSQINPLFGDTEDCLKELMNESYQLFSNEYNQLMLNRQIEDEVYKQQICDNATTIISYAPYALLTVGLFAGYYAYKGITQKNNVLKNHNPASFSSRLQNMGYEGEIPVDFLCPISLAIMDNPVTAKDGKIYDRTSIEEWLKRSSISPIIPSIRMDQNSLQPNHKLMEKINAFVTQLEEPNTEHHDDVRKKTTTHRHHRPRRR